MENRDKDKVSRNNTSSTEAGDLNRETPSRIGNQQDESDAEFGRNIGRPEDLDEPNRRGGNVDDEGMKGSMGKRSRNDSDSSSDMDKGDIGVSERSSRNSSGEFEH